MPGTLNNWIPKGSEKTGAALGFKLLPALLDATPWGTLDGDGTPRPAPLGKPMTHIVGRRVFWGAWGWAPENLRTLIGIWGFLPTALEV